MGAPVTRLTPVLALALAFASSAVFAIAFAYHPSPSYYSDARGHVVSVRKDVVPLVKGGSSMLRTPAPLASGDRQEANYRQRFFNLRAPIGCAQ